MMTSLPTRAHLCAVLVATLFLATTAAAQTSGEEFQPSGGWQLNGADWQLLSKEGTRAISAPVAAGAVVVPSPVALTFELVAGRSLELQLQGWAKRAGWTFSWNVQKDWIVPSGEAFGTNFEEAAQRVIEELASNGADVRADIYTGNHTVVVHQAGAAE
jgi:hypothetical protein